MCPFAFIHFVWHPAHLFTRIGLHSSAAFLVSYVKTYNSMCRIPCSAKFSVFYAFAALLFTLVNIHEHICVCPELRKLQPCVSTVLSLAGLLLTGTLPSQWLDITKSLAELGEMGSPPAAASITPGTTGIKLAS